MAFLRNLLATILGLFIFFFLLIMLLGGIAASSETVPVVEDNSVLILNLDGILSERTVEDPFMEAFGNGPRQTGLNDLLFAIENARFDSKIRGIYIRPQYLQAGFASLQEVRDALIAFKESGKFIYAYGDYLSEGDYYVASVADSLFLNPEGALEFNGLTIGVTFFKGLFDKLDIEPEIFRVGEFKSYVEPFIRKDMSEENRLQLSELIESVHGTYLENVSKSTLIPLEELVKISDQMLVRSPQDAVNYGLISKVAYEDEMTALLKQELGLSKSDDIRFISAKSYALAATDDYSANKIAVIVANGDIVVSGDQETVGGEQFAEEIRKARESSSVKAIVLRVNSPGGSLTGSDMIWREVMLTKGVKPIIASMSDVAASGGYYISMACDTIVAQPNTITGSIGIFGIMFNFGNFLENKLGITNDQVSTGEYSDLMTVTRSLNESERAIIQAQVEDGYNTFITKAANGRGLPVEQLKKVAGGRVWTGEQAYERGLVDVLGSFDDAVAIAAEKAGVVADYRVRFYPEQKPFFEEVLDKLSNPEALIFQSKENPLAPYLKTVESLQQMNGVQALMPGNLQIH